MEESLLLPNTDSEVNVTMRHMETGTKLNIDAENDYHQMTTATSLSFREYLRSNEFKELLIYGLILGIPAILLKVIPHRPYDRSIPFQAMYDAGGDYVQNLSYDLKEMGQTFPTWCLALIGLITFLSQLFLSWKVGNVGDVHSTVCVYLIVVSLTNMLTHIMKYYCGYLRPIFYDMCQPNYANGEAVCTQDSDFVRKSFPSGHSSMSFCIMVLLTGYLRQRFGVSTQGTELTVSPATFNNEIVIQYRVKKSTIRQRLFSLFSFFPLVLAFFISGSRVHDNYHHPADIVGGAALGAGIAVYFNQIWFPATAPIINLNNSSI